MSEKEKQQLLQELGNYINIPTASLSSVALITLFRSNGEFTLAFLSIIVSVILKLNLGWTSALVAISSFCVLIGPIGMALSALWTTIDFAGPAYRITQPAVIYIAAMRRIKQQQLLI